MLNRTDKLKDVVTENIALCIAVGEDPAKKAFGRIVRSFKRSGNMLSREEKEFVISFLTQCLKGMKTDNKVVNNSVIDAENIGKEVIPAVEAGKEIPVVKTDMDDIKLPIGKINLNSTSDKVVELKFKNDKDKISLSAGLNVTKFADDPVNGVREIVKETKREIANESAAALEAWFKEGRPEDAPELAPWQISMINFVKRL